MYASVSKCWIKNVQIWLNYNLSGKWTVLNLISLSLSLPLSSPSFALCCIGWSTFLHSLNCTLLARAMVPWAWLYRLLWCNYIKIISSLGGVSYAKSAPLGAARRRFTQVFVIDDICRCVLYVSVHRLIDRSHSNSCTRRATRSSLKHMPTNEMGICDSI